MIPDYQFKNISDLLKVKTNHSDLILLKGDFKLKLPLEENIKAQNTDKLEDYIRLLHNYIISNPAIISDLNSKNNFKINMNRDIVYYDDRLLFRNYEGFSYISNPLFEKYGKEMNLVGLYGIKFELKQEYLSSEDYFNNFYSPEDILIIGKDIDKTYLSFYVD